MADEPIIQKKICLLGAHAVGKTSLVGRFVKSIFSEKYHTSIGVKIDKKVVPVGSDEVNLIIWDVAGAAGKSAGAKAREVSLTIWDLAGEDEFGPLDVSYLRGASGYLLVIDGTRRSTLDRALTVQQRAEEKVGPVPFIVLVNKADLAAEWELSEADLREITDRGWPMYRTSAKTGDFVETAFQSLARAMLVKT